MSDITKNKHLPDKTNQIKALTSQSNSINSNFVSIIIETRIEIKICI